MGAAGSRVIAALLLLGAAPLAAQSPLTVLTEPAEPVGGSLFRLTVGGAPPGELRGVLAGEPLHFHAGRRGSTALAALPLDGARAGALTLIIRRPNGSPDTVSRSLPGREASRPAERLRVAPRFAEPDTAATRRIEGEVAEARAIARAAHGTPRLWTAPFLPPRPGRVTSSFGGGRTFNGRVLSRHLGTDFAGAVGAPVRASNRGVVALVADFYLAGHAVYIDHGEGITTGYFHLSRGLVQAGDTVARGQIIGRVGQSGRVTGPHLHWTARYGELPVDPLSLLRVSRRPAASVRPRRISAARQGPAARPSDPPCPGSASSPARQRRP